MTQEQIDAGRRAYEKAWDEHKTFDECLVAALSAAAPTRDFFINCLKDQVAILQKKLAAAEAPAPHFWSGAEQVHLATIERCAQWLESINMRSVALDMRRAMKDKPPAV